MKSGMEMMLESMGIQTGIIKQLLEPERIKTLLNKVETMFNSVEEIKASVLRIEIELNTLPLEQALKLLADGQSEAFREAAEYVRDNSEGSSNNRNVANG
jgi:hypothetical protein